MKTYDIFIDFECICGGFARRLNKAFNQIPLSYTIGYRNKQKETKTLFELFDFKKKVPNNNNFTNNILEDFSKSLITNINKLINRKEPVRMEEINFIGWNPQLEEQLLSSMYKKRVPINSLINTCFEESNLITKREVSLSKVTKNGYKDTKYFTEFRKEFAKTLSPEDISKFNLTHDGAIASYAGFVLYSIIMKTKKTKFHIYMSAEILINELKEYSLDDINRMYYFLDNIPEVKSTIRKFKIIDNLKKDINTNVRLLELLENYNPNIKIKDLIKKLETSNDENKKKIVLFE